MTEVNVADKLILDLDRSKTSTENNEAGFQICEGNRFFLHCNNKSNFSFQSSPSKAFNIQLREGKEPTVPD